MNWVLIVLLHQVGFLRHQYKIETKKHSPVKTTEKEENVSTWESRVILPTICASLTFQIFYAHSSILVSPSESGGP